MPDNFKLLIIDDSDVILDILKRFLIQKNYDVSTALNGLEGIQLFNAQPALFDLVITDMVMPDISGVGVISILKKERPDIPIIAITGYGPHAEILASEANADIILEKPIDLSVLNQHIISLITKAQ